MRSLLISAFFGFLGASGISLSAGAETDNGRTVAMPYTECLSIIDEASQEVDEVPVKLVSTDELTTVRINASDGFVTVSCSRADNMMTLTKSPVPGAAGMTAAR